jgi:hypothetical protein
MAELFKKCIYTQASEFGGGKSDSLVHLVSDDTGVSVRKTSRSGQIPSTRQGTEHDMLALDEKMFPGETLLNPTTICSSCEEMECLVSKYIEGAHIDGVLCLDGNPKEAHHLRMMVIEIMEKKGYFNQKGTTKDKAMWEQWLEKRANLLTSILNKTTELSSILDEEDTVELQKIIHKITPILTNPDKEIPVGIFPRDITPGNALIGENGKPILIDQHIFEGDPVIVPIKLTFGWRLLSNTYTDYGVLSNSFKKHLSLKEEIEQLDAEMLEKIKSFYPDDPDFESRYHAAMIIRHIRGLEFVLKENRDSMPIESIREIASEIMSYIYLANSMIN